MPPSNTASGRKPNSMTSRMCSPPPPRCATAGERRKRSSARSRSTLRIVGPSLLVKGSDRRRLSIGRSDRVERSAATNRLGGRASTPACGARGAIQRDRDSLAALVPSGPAPSGRRSVTLRPDRLARCSGTPLSGTAVGQNADSGCVASEDLVRHVRPGPRGATRYRHGDPFLASSMSVGSAIGEGVGSSRPGGSERPSSGSPGAAA